MSWGLHPNHHPSHGPWLRIETTMVFGILHFKKSPYLQEHTTCVFFFFKREYIDVGKHIKAHQSPRKGLNRSKMSKSCRLGAYSWMADPVIFAYSLFFLGENCKWIHILGPCIMMIMINYVYYYMFSCYHYHCIRIVWKLCVCAFSDRSTTVPQPLECGYMSLYLIMIRSFDE